VSHLSEPRLLNFRAPNKSVTVEADEDGAEEEKGEVDRATCEGRVCQGDLSNVGIGDFHVSLSVTTTQGRLVALLNQRGQCNPSVFWDIRMIDALVSRNSSLTIFA